MWCYGVLGLIVGCVACLGCDDSADVPPELLKNDQQVEEPPPRPTTQELREGSRNPLVLDTLPLRMQVPESWKITRHSGSVVWLEGPTPNSDARIALKHRETIPHAQYESFLRGTRRDQEQEKNTIIDIRTTGTMTIVDRRSFLNPSSSPEVDAQGIPKLDDKGQIVMQTTIPMRWWLHCFVPFEDRVDQFELSFVAITKGEYDQDREFLEKILATLEYIGPQPTTQPTTAPATSPVDVIDLKQ